MPRYSNNDLAEMRLSAGRLSEASSTDRQMRCLARFDGSPVLLEFKSASGLDHNMMKDRVCKVSAFLRDLDPSFHGLSCIGYVKVWNRYAYVFDLQELSSPSNAQLPSLRTLRELLDGITCPSLNSRLSYAITILEALLQLHTSGWLHKEFRSDNILFILSSFDHIDDFVLAPMRIAGYANARADEPFESTEPLESELEADLYRHPACLQQPRESFRRTFDIFSVGCILLEIGLWCKLSALFQRASDGTLRNEVPRLDLLRLRHEMLLSPINRTNPENAYRTGSVEKMAPKQNVFRRLEASMGRAYAEIVKALLYASTVGKPAMESEAHKDNNLLHFEMDCLERLRTIAEVI